tara:strand:- start:1521 stop:1907 length:387 start_codon:yes stop_codon:yes gene_type:complete
MEVRKSFLKKLKSITGTQYILTVILIAFLKYLLGYYVSANIDVAFFDILLINISGVILILMNWFRTRRFKEWEWYFSLLMIFGIIHSIGFFYFSPEELLNSFFNVLIKLSNLGVLVITLVITISNSNK